MADNENLNNEEFEEYDLFEFEDAETGEVYRYISLYDFFYNGENYYAVHELAENEDADDFYSRFLDGDEECMAYNAFVKATQFEENGEQMEEDELIDDEELSEELAHVLEECMENDADLDDAD